MRGGGEGREKAFQDTANASCDPMELSKMAAHLNHLTRFLSPISFLLTQFLLMEPTFLHFSVSPNDSEAYNSALLCLAALGSNFFG